MACCAALATRTVADAKWPSPLHRFQAEFKASRFPQAIEFYSKSIERAMQRPPWEMTNFCREEATSALLNRSAAFGSMKNWCVLLGRRAGPCVQADKGEAPA